MKELKKSEAVAQVRWTISNLLSLSRIVLLIPILYLLLGFSDRDRIYPVLLLLVAASTDFLDGLIARKFGQESVFGRILDPLADKIFAGAIVIVLAGLGEVPAWFVIMVIARDTLILLGGLYIAKVKGVIHRPNWTGKWTMTIVTAYLIVATLRLEQLQTVENILLILSIGFLALSLLLYLKRFYETVFSNNQVLQEPSR